MADLNQLLTLCARGYYNGERRELYYSLLKKLLLSPDLKINIQQEIESSPAATLERAEGDKKVESFKRFDTFITSGLDIATISEYVLTRYKEFDNLMNEKYGIPVSVFILISTLLIQLINKREGQPDGVPKNAFPVYEFEREEDISDPKIFVKPDEEYIHNYNKAFRVKIVELKEYVHKDKLISTLDLKNLDEHVNKFIELYSFDIDKLKAQPDLRFREFPLLHINDEIIFIDPSVYFKYLPHKIHSLLLTFEEFSRRKGKIFENMTYELLKEIPYSTVESKNIVYDEGEIDFLLNLRRSTWVVECKSRHIATTSFLGDTKRIAHDIQEAILKAIEQSEKSMTYVDSGGLKSYKINRIKGILIILEAVFPNLSDIYPFEDSPVKQAKYPICILNYFELKKILEQHDSQRFEEFLIWRSDKDMPIMALDELEYWAYFNDMYHGNKLMKKTYELAKSKHNIVIYISKRFNTKDHLKKIMKNRVHK
jgi:Holliday junction resolvase-like predicted endonuclease